MNNLNSSNSGYVYLITVLVIGIIASGITISLLVMAISSTKTGIVVENSAKAMESAKGCAEYGINKLFNNPSYAGGEIINIGETQCEILNISGFGNENRAICTESIVGSTTRRLEIIIKRVLPEVKVYSWQEVYIINACSY